MFLLWVTSGEYKWVTLAKRRCHSLGIAVKTLQEPKTGPLEPFEIADAFQYLLLFEQLANKGSRGSMYPPGLYGCETVRNPRWNIRVLTKSAIAP
jgi:hypothetical protein